MNQTFKKTILLGVLPLCLVTLSYGALVEEGRGRSPSSSPIAFLENDAVERRGADYSGADDTSESEWEEGKIRKPGALGETIFAKFGGKKVFRRHKKPEDLETERKSPSPGKIGNVRMDEVTRETFRDHIDESLAHINNRKWGNSLKGQQAKYDAFVEQLTEDDLSGPEMEGLKTLTSAERSILEELGLSSGIESENEDVFQPKKQVLQSSTPKRSESEEEESQKTIQSMDQKTVNAFRAHVKRVAKEVGDLNWFTSTKEQKNKFDALVTRLRTTFYRH